VREPSARELVAVWERGSSQSLGEQGLELLALAEDSAGISAASRVGSRDAALLRIRRRYFGDRLGATAYCSRCGEQLEVVLSVSELLESELKNTVSGHVVVEHDGVTVTCRVPTAADVLALGDVHDVDEGVSLLLTRCLSDPGDNSTRLRPEEPTSALVDAIAQELGLADPCGDLTLTLACPTCNVVTEAIIDITSFLWTEIRQLALALVCDVHTIARSYGWDEATILDMSGARRRAYLDLIQT
jgi:hypothetical protein